MPLSGLGMSPEDDRDVICGSAASTEIASIMYATDVASLARFATLALLDAVLQIAHVWSGGTVPAKFPDKRAMENKT